MAISMQYLNPAVVYIDGEYNYSNLWIGTQQLIKAYWYGNSFCVTGHLWRKSPLITHLTGVVVMWLHISSSQKYDKVSTVSFIVITNDIQ